MPKMSDRERLADLEQRQRRLAEDVDTARRALRGTYAAAVTDLAVEALSEREFRDVISAAIRVGGVSAIAALRALPPAAADPKSAAKSPQRGGPAASTAEPRAAGEAIRQAEHRAATGPGSIAVRVPELRDLPPPAKKGPARA